LTNIFALIATVVLSLSLAFAQTLQAPSGSDGTTANQQADNNGHHDYGWVGLLGLPGLAGLAGRRRGNVTQERDRGVSEELLNIRFQHSTPRAAPTRGL
jgi:MYXO-CTERM domain-containing protein